VALDAHVPRELVDKYDQPGPRYTSYPTVPEWSADFGQADVEAALAANARDRAGLPLSLYIHVPFCAKLCYYCGCNIHLTRDDDLVERYIAAVDREVGGIADLVDAARPVVQIHWGGGTPTHLNPDQLTRLFGTLTKRFNPAKDAEISLEVHPNVTSRAQMQTLSGLGFNRISMGVQDFDPAVQKAVNRLQPFEVTRDLVETARSLNFQSVNLDLMYGLPLQTLEGFRDTLAKVGFIRPDRVALFNYAHLPAMFPHQKAFRELPDRQLKLDLFELAIDYFVGQGYQYIGMDHFALPENELSRSRQDRTLRRNFMGYTTCADSDLLSFGMSAISDLDGAFYQNERKLPGYFEAVEAGKLPIIRGMNLSPEDKLRRDVIYTLACHGYLDKGKVEARYGIAFDEHFSADLDDLRDMERDRLVEVGPDAITVLPRGQVLIRNVCMPFDAYLRARPAAARRYSRTV
jgi:oxygen-independent coproporphyrinogen-3 oxidase